MVLRMLFVAARPHVDSLLRGVWYQNARARSNGVWLRAS